MDTREYLKEKISHDVNGAELEHAIQYYLTHERGLNTGDFSLTGVNKEGVDGYIFPDTAIEATKQKSQLDDKFCCDAEDVGENEEFDSLLYFTTGSSSDIESKEEIEDEYGLDVEIIDHEKLVDLTYEIQMEAEKRNVNDKDAAFNQVFKQ